MRITWNNRELIFNQIVLNFNGAIFENVFARKNNKNVAETLRHRRYEEFKDEVEHNYPQCLNWGIGTFLMELKSRGDDFYRKFLNKYGDKKYSMFFIDDKRYIDKKGLYMYVIEGSIQYIGRCKDAFKKRINQGYGKIHPKNCYIDGQSTNCHLKHLITENRDNIELFVCEMQNDDDIIKAEKGLITRLKPKWNFGLSRE